MISLIWEKGKDAEGHNICLVDKLPDPHVTKWMIYEMKISLGKDIKNGDLIAQNKLKTKTWYGNPRTFKWDRII
jgi:hypothetical protein